MVACFPHKCRNRESREDRKLACVNSGGNSSAIPGGIGRNRRVVASHGMGGYIAGHRLRGFNIRAHVHGDPRVAKPSPSNHQCKLPLIHSTIKHSDNHREGNRDCVIKRKVKLDKKRTERNRTENKNDQPKARQPRKPRTDT